MSFLRERDTWDSTFGIHFSDLYVTTIGVDVTNTLGAFGTLNGVFLVSLTDPTWQTTPIPFRNQYDVRTLHWNKCVAPILACSSNDKVYVWDTSRLDATPSPSARAPSPSPYTLAPAGGDAGEAHIVLGKHVRSVNDIEWQAQSPHILASCSSDAYIYIWDTREPSTEQRAFTSYRMDRSGVSQLAWNRSDGNILASTHGGFVRIWDMRKESLPVKCIRAHESQIFGIDWSHTNESELVTCALDKLVKFWDVNNPENFIDYIQTSSPIRRAKYTPFGSGLVTASSSTHTDLKLWSRNDLSAPVHTFTSSSVRGQPTDFVWRYTSSKFQLMSWSSDTQLRFWACDDDVLRSVGHKVIVPRLPLSSTTSLPPPSSSSSPGAASSSSPSSAAASAATNPSSSSPLSVPGASPSPTTSSPPLSSSSSPQPLSSSTPKPSSTSSLPPSGESSSSGNGGSMGSPLSPDGLPPGKSSVGSPGSGLGILIGTSSESDKRDKRDGSGGDQDGDLVVITSPKDLDRDGASGSSGRIDSPLFALDRNSSIPMLEQEISYLKTHPVAGASLDRANVGARLVFLTFSTTEVQLNSSQAELRVRLMFPISYPDKGPTVEFVQRSFFSSRSKDTQMVSPDVKIRLKELASALIQVRERDSLPSLHATVSELATQFGLLQSAKALRIGDEPGTGSRVHGELGESSKPVVASSFICPRLGGAYFGPSGRMVVWNCFSSSLFRLSNPSNNNTTQDEMDDGPGSGGEPRRDGRRRHRKNRRDGDPGSSRNDRSQVWPAVWADLTLSLEMEQQGRKLRQADDKDMAATSVLASMLEGRPALSGSVSLSRGAGRESSSHQETTVRIVSAARWIMASPPMAKEYLVYEPGKSLSEICAHNAGVAARARRKDLVRVWKLCSVALARYSPEAWSPSPDVTPYHLHANALSAWASHPFGRQTVLSLLNHYERLGDVQTLAMLAAIFSSADMVAAVLEPGSAVPNRPQLLDAELQARTWPYRAGYCKLLDAWSLPIVRALVAKFDRRPEARAAFESDVAMANTCIRHPSASTASAQCFSCSSSHFILKCSLCRYGVKGIATACLRCGHGGHVSCLRSWHTETTQCPTGCGCDCIFTEKGMLESQNGVLVP